MEENNKALTEEVKKLTKENKELHRKLKVAQEFLNIFKSAHIDAVVIPGDKALKVYTEKTSDKTYMFSTTRSTIIANNNHSFF